MARHAISAASARPKGLTMKATTVTRHIKAPRSAIYRALLDSRAVRTWMVPDGMTSHVHAFDAREGGEIRISLTYDTPNGTGKTDAGTDTYHGHLVTLVPDRQVIEMVQFETTDPSMQGMMTITFVLDDAPGGTNVVAHHDNLPPGISSADNEKGWKMALDKLATLVEG
jgi:uncharacterized protein YndB with AHSA1/START domain